MYPDSEDEDSCIMDQESEENDLEQSFEEETPDWLFLYRYIYMEVLMILFIGKELFNVN